MRWTRQRRREEGSQGGFPVSGYDHADERRFARLSLLAKTGVFGEAFLLSWIAAYGKTVWAWHPLLMSSWRRRSRANRFDQP
jgi:hypothetical protein